MFGWRDSGLDQVLNRLAAELPETRWLLLMDEHGIEKASFPNFIDGTDRIAAMSVASSSLGERVVKELKGGGLRYTLFAGTLNVHLIVMLPPRYVLALGLRPGVSIEVLFDALQGAIAPLLDGLEVELPDGWLE